MLQLCKELQGFSSRIGLFPNFFKIVRQLFAKAVVSYQAKNETMKASNLSFLLVFLFIGLFQCHQLKEDTLPDQASNPFDAEADNVVVLLTNGQGLINLPGLFHNSITSDEVEIAKMPERGTISKLNQQYLVYRPNLNETDYEEDIILKVPGNGNDNVQVPVRLVVRSATPDYCLVEDFNPTYLGTPLKYTVRKGESLEVDFTDLFCDFSRTPSGGVRVQDHPDFSNEFLQIHITTSSALFTYTPPEDFVGTQGVIYELCYDYTGRCEFDWFECGDFPRACRFFLYTFVELEVVE